MEEEEDGEEEETARDRISRKRAMMEQMEADGIRQEATSAMEKRLQEEELKQKPAQSSQRWN